VLDGLPGVGSACGGRGRLRRQLTESLGQVLGGLVGLGVFGPALPRHGSGRVV
jgi:hypothetical protein